MTPGCSTPTWFLRRSRKHYISMDKRKLWLVWGTWDVTKMKIKDYSIRYRLVTTKNWHKAGVTVKQDCSYEFAESKSQINSEHDSTLGNLYLQLHEAEVASPDREFNGLKRGSVPRNIFWDSKSLHKKKVHYLTDCWKYKHTHCTGGNVKACSVLSEFIFIKKAR